MHLGRVVLTAASLSLSCFPPGFAHNVNWSSAVCPAPVDACLAAMPEVVDAFAKAHKFETKWTSNKSIVQIMDIDGTDIHIWYKCDADINGYVAFVFETDTEDNLRKSIKAEFATLITDRLGVTCKS